jgi:hypothetical protein
MYQKLKLAAVGLVAVALTACNGNGSSMPAPGNLGNGTQSVVQRGGGSMADAGIDPTKVHIMRTANSLAPLANPNNLQYFGGPIERHPATFVVFWGFNKSGSDPSHEKVYMIAFLKGIGGSPWLATDKQYYQVSGTLHQHIMNPVGQFKGSWVDPSTVPANPSDAQVRAEAAAAEAHFGYNVDGNYIVATPHNHNSPGFGTSFCAYHSPTSSSGGEISYTNEPYMTDAGSNCGENFVNPGPAGVLDGASIVLGHEEAESQTDPQVNVNTAWAGNLGEIGDACAWQGLADITLTTGKFAIQPLWSNAKNGCTTHTP